MYLQEENPCSLGKEKPYKLPQSDKKPQFTMSTYSSGPIGLRLRPVLPSLDYLNSLGTTASFSSLSKAGVHYVPARPCRSIAVYLLLFLPYLDRPLCAISCLTIAIYTIPPSPLRPIKGVRGIHPFQPPNTAGYVYIL